MGAYSIRQMQQAGVQTDPYHPNEKEGVFIAKLDFKRWGKKRNVLAYFTLENGDKIVASAWQDAGYLGIPDIEEGTRVILTFEKSKNGTPYLRKVERAASKFGLTP